MGPSQNWTMPFFLFIYLFIFFLGGGGVIIYMYSRVLP